MKTVFITGIAGFIGSSTAKKLLDKGYRVVGVDNLNDYYDPKLKKARLDLLKSYSDNVKIYKADITDYKVMDKIFSNEKIDKVCHLAAQAGVRYSIENPFAYQEVNLLGTLNMLELCRHHGVKDFIYASSSSVYGNNDKMPFSEKHPIDTPMSLYAATKKANEAMAYTYHHLYGLNCTGLRFFTVYGPWGRPDMALFKFTKGVIEQTSIDVYNYGKMFRDFTYIDDIVDGVIKSLEKSYPYEIFNLAKGETVELLTYIEEIENTLGKKAIMNMMPIQPGDVPKTSADITKAQDMLGYAPKTSVDEGVRNFVNWYIEYYK